MNYTDDPYVLSIDIGTSSIRALVFDGKGNPCKELGAQTPYSINNTPDGGAFIPLEIISGLVYQTIDLAIRKIDEQHVPITAVSICTFWHNVAGVNKDGLPATPLLSWNDTRPESMISELQTKIDAEEFTSRTGCPMHASYLPAKILWLWGEDSYQAKQVRYWMPLGDYLLFQIFHERICSVSMASGTGLFNGFRCEWDEKILSCLPVKPEQFSPLYKHDENSHSHPMQTWQMLPEFARPLACSAGSPMVPGTW